MIAKMPTKTSHQTRYGALLATLLILLVSFLQGLPALAQTANASLSGIVTDKTGARIPGAKVELLNEGTQDKRQTVTNKVGVFDFAGVGAGKFTVIVNHADFVTEAETGIELHPGDSSTLPTITLTVGAEGQTITVKADETLQANGEVSSLITAEDIQHLATEGRDVTELVKILPGFALQPGSSDAASFGLSNSSPNNEVAGPGGSLGNYAANGAPSNGIGLISDGANVQDPGIGGSTTQTINMDAVQEVKVSTSNFGADTAKGPVVINAVGKSGGKTYHGSVYMIGRTHQLNAQDWLVKNQGQPKPNDRYIYPGFSVGGPVKILGTHFNDSKKMTFQLNAEDYIQRNTFFGGSGVSALHLSTVPTDAMRGGDFSNAALANLLNVPVGTPNTPGTLLGDCNPNKVGGNLYVFINFCQQAQGYTPAGNPLNNGMFNPADIDPGIQAYLNHIIPHQNRQAEQVLGTAQESDADDRIDLFLTNYDLYQVRGRLDYNFSANNKLYGVYNIQNGYQFSPFALTGNVNNTYGGAVSDPTQVKQSSDSQTASANFVHIFSPTLTSETFAASSYFLTLYNPVNQNANTRAALGYPYTNIIPNGSLQLPNLGYGSGAGIPLYLGPDFSYGRFFRRTISVDAGENLTKVYKKHTIKLGFYFEHLENNQRLVTGSTQGDLAEYGTYGTFHYPTATGYGISKPLNTIASFMFGAFNYYSQESSNPIIDLFYNVIDGFVTDSFKVTRRLTIDAGVRLDHLGPWTDPHHIGPAFWYPQNYSTPSAAYSTLPLCAGTSLVPPACTMGFSVAQFPGLNWHDKTNSITDAVQNPRWAFPSPRVGFALDVYGTGRTVLNGGFGFYRSHDNYNDYAGALGTSRGVVNSYYNNITLACANEIGLKTISVLDPICGGYSTNPLGGNYLASNSYGISALDPNDDQQPLTLTYSAGINQSMRHLGNVIINYTGNRSNHLLLSNGFVNNVNTIPLGGLFQPDPNPLSPGYGVVSGTPDAIGYTGSYTLVDDYRPYPFYSNISVPRHVASSNYNALQATWSKTNGPFHYNFNYTWSKAMGQRGVDGNSSAPDATNLHNDYGIAAYDRTHIFNASYSYIEGKPFHAERIVSGFVNGWEISGITNLQSGPNLQASYSNNFQLSTLTPTTGATSGQGCSGVSPTTGLPVGCTQTGSTDNKTYLGTPDILLQPVMTCDPSRNRGHGVFINASCLTLGPLGVNGPFTYPYLRGPAFLNSDLSAQKTFAIGDKKAIQVRFAAFNFLNHPLTSLVAATAAPLKLTIAGPGGPANPAFGISDYKQGRRVSEITVRFNF